MPTISMRSNKTAWLGKIEWSYTQNISSNTSTVYARVGTWKTDGVPSSATSGAHFKGILQIGDEYVEFSFQQQNVASEDSPQWHAELETTVKHSSDGSCNVAISCKIDAPSGLTLSDNPLIGEKTISLDPIGGASSISSASNVDIGSPCIITWTPASSAFHYKIKFAYGSWSDTTETISPNATSSFSYTGYTIPLSLAEYMPNSTSGSVSVSLYTYRDSACKNQVGLTTTSSFIATVPDNIRPTMDSISISVVNDPEGPICDWGVAIAGYSCVRITATASGTYGSTIKSYSLSSPYSTAVYGSTLDYTGSIIRSSGNKAFTVYCTDSRGRTSSEVVTDTILFLPYTTPKVNSVSVLKETYGTDDLEDDRMTVTADWVFDPIGDLNEVTATVYYKETSAQDWIPHSGVLENGVAFVLSDLKLDETKSYNFQVVVTDLLGNSDAKASFASTTTVLLDFKAGGDGLGIGKICSDLGGLEVSMESTFFNEIYIGGRDTTLAQYIKAQLPAPIDTCYPVGSIYISTSTTSPAQLFGGSWVEVNGRFLLGSGTPGQNTDDSYGDISANVGSFALKTTGGQDLHKLTVDELPSHDHGFRGYLDTVGSDGPSTYALRYDENLDYVNTKSEYIAKTGDDSPHNNMPPYYVVNIWERIDTEVTNEDY